MNSVEDLVAEIEDNFKVRDPRNEELSYSVVQLDPPRSGVEVLTIDARGTRPTQTVGVTVEVTADRSFLTAEYFGISASPGRWPIPKDPNGNFALYPGNDLLEICNQIFKPLSVSSGG